MNHLFSFMQVNISLVTHVDININKYLLSLVFLRLKVGSISNFLALIGSRYKICSPGLTRSKKYGLGLDPSQKKQARPIPSNFLTSTIVLNLCKKNLHFVLHYKNFFALI